MIARAASTYRAARRNAVRAAHQLPVWRNEHGIRATMRVDWTHRHRKTGVPTQYSGEQLRVMNTHRGVGRPT